MKLQISKIESLKRPPTSIIFAFDRIYVSTKGNRVYYSQKERGFKGIKFSNKVFSLCSSDKAVYCAQTDGNIFGLNSLNKVVFRAFIGDQKTSSIVFNDDLFCSQKAKITVLGETSIVKNTFFFNELPIVDFDAFNKKIAVCTLNCQKINISDSEKFDLKILDGFPEFVKFYNSDFLLVGSSTGFVHLFSLENKKRCSYLKLDGAISALTVISNTLLVGTSSLKIYLIEISEENKLILKAEETVDGIPIGFCNDGNVFYSALSRESRSGRWYFNRKSHNQVISIKLIEVS